MKKLFKVEGLRILQTLILLGMTFFVKNKLGFIWGIRVLLILYLVYLVFSEKNIILKRLKRNFFSPLEIPYKNLRPKTWWILGILLSCMLYLIVQQNGKGNYIALLFMVTIIILGFRLLESSIYDDTFYLNVFDYERKEITIPEEAMDSIIKRKSKKWKDADLKMEIYTSKVRDIALKEAINLNFVDEKYGPYFVDSEELLRLWTITKLPSIEEKIMQEYEKIKKEEAMREIAKNIKIF